jgi:PAS domain S-box-containing protein
MDLDPHCYPNSDALNLILKLQAVMVAAPDLARLGEECCSNCRELPGVGEVALIQNGEVVTATEGFGDVASDKVTHLELEGGHGSLVLTVEDPALFAAYLPFLENTAMLFSLILENLRQGQEVLELNRSLTRDIEVQTRHLRQSEERYRALVESAPEAIVLLDPERMEFTELNAMAVQLFGWSREHQPGGESSVDACAAYVMEVRRGASPVFEWAFTHKDGGVLLAEVRLVRTDFDTRTLIRASISDITERRRLEEQLRQSLKMEAVGQLSGGLAHDFNNLLVAILGNAELLQKELGGESTGQSMLAEIRQSAIRGAELTQRLLAFSRKHVLKPSVLKLEHLVGELSGLLERSLGDTVEIQTRSQEDLWACHADAGQVENCLLNLMINSRDAMPEGGEITVDLRNEEIRCPLLAQEIGLELGEYVSLAVIDNGVGIPLKDQLKVLEPFFTTKDMGKGTGLGLSMVYGFAKQSKGSLQLTSRVGQGTTVRMYFPKDGEAPCDAQVQSHEIGESLGESILLVEDDLAVRRTVEFLLKDLGYQVESAEDADSALKLLAEMPNVELMLSDIRLTGGVHGPELAERVRELRPQIKLLFMSGYVGERDPFEGRFADARLLPKPFTRTDLAKEVRRALEGAGGAARMGSARPARRTVSKLN